MKLIDIMEQAYRIYFDNASKAAKTRFELAQWCSWARGSMILKGGISAIPEFPVIPDNLEIAKSTLNLLMQPMITLWFHNWEKRELHSAEEMIEARKIAYENVQTFLNIHSSEVVTIHLILDVELTYLLSELRESSAYYCGMFHQRYRECVLQKKNVNWTKIKPPIEDWIDFVNLCEKNEYMSLPEHKLAFFSLIPDAQKRMFDDFQEILHGEKLT